MTHNAGIDWQAIFSAFEHGQTPASAQAHAQLVAQQQEQQQAQAHGQAQGHNDRRRPGRHDSETGQEESESVGSSPAVKQDSGMYTRTPSSASTSTSPSTAIASPKLDTHRYHPAHAQAAAAAQAQAQALVAEAVARNAPIPDDLFAHFARANGILESASPISNADSWGTPRVAASPDLNARLAEQFGYIPQQLASPQLPALAPRVLPGPSPIDRQPNGPNGPTRQGSIPISPAGQAGPSGLPSIAPSLASGSATPFSAPTPLDSEDVEDKRVRNTLASARFRAKKKQYIETVERNIRDLENQHRELEVEVNDLRKENGLLKDMVQLKYGGVRQ